VQPKAVLKPTSSRQRLPAASRSARMRPISATTSSGVLRRLARLCAWLADSGSSMACAPLSSAACAPFRLGTSTLVTRPGQRQRGLHQLGGVGQLRQQPCGHERAHLQFAQAGGVRGLQPFDLLRRGHGAADALQAVAQAHVAHGHEAGVGVHAGTLGMPCRFHE
jgi:hypothetical protein